MRHFVYDNNGNKKEIYLVKEKGFYNNNDINNFLKSDCIVDINGNTFGRVIFDNMTIGVDYANPITANHSNIFEYVWANQV